MTNSASLRTAQIFCLLALLIGTALRLIWPADMEWKYDEKWMTQHANAVVQGVERPLVGMPSGAGGLVNPGLSVWTFAALAALTGGSPIALVRFVMVLNVLALWFFWFWIQRRTRPEARATWLWALSLWAASALPVLYSRKIWAQSVLPFFSVILLWAWSWRHRPLGAFVYGFLGLALGQIHMSGFFFFAALFVWTWWKQDRRTPSLATPWFLWGVALAAWPLVPWMRFVAAGVGSGLGLWDRLKNIASLKFYTHGLATAWGFDLGEILNPDFASRMIRHPLFWAPLAILAAAFLVRLALWGRREKSEMSADAPTVQLSVAFWLVMGVLLTLTGVNGHAHYLIVGYPILFFFPAWWIGRRRGASIWLIAMVAAHLCLSCAVLWDLHVHGGAPSSDYGTSYRMQVK